VETENDLLDQIDDVDAQLDKLLANDTLTDQQQQQHDELVQRRGDLKDRARKARRLADAPHRRPGANRRTDPDLPGSRADRIQVRDPEFLKDPNKGFRTPKEFLLAVMHAGHAGFGAEIDQRLLPLRQATAGSDEQSTISDPYGGFLVPVGFIPDFLKVTPEGDILAPFTRKIPMTQPTVKLPARTDKDHTTSVSGGLVVGRKPETVAATASRMQTEQIVLSANIMIGLTYATEEILTDSAVAFAALLASSFTEEFAAQHMRERISGTGTGEFEGVLNSPALISVAKTTGQAAKTIVLENIVQMRSQCWNYARAIWLANQDTLPQLMLLNQQVGVAGTGMIWLPSARDMEPDRLLGRPLFFSEFCATLGSVGDIILADWSQYLEGEYQPLQSAESIHVRFTNHERTFKFWKRGDARSWWRAALTPAKSSKQLSPCVTLSAR
jgi:HK97 family phage major capsid protein